MNKIERQIVRETLKQAKRDEIIARKVQRQAAKLLRAEERAKKQTPKEQLSEAELVLRYVNRTIKNQMYHGRVDADKFQNLEHTHSVSKQLWMDADFFFSVVFQSQAQKMAFLKAVKWPVNQREQCQIVNGVQLAKLMGIELKLETSREYPTGNLELMPLVLDNESPETLDTPGEKNG